MFESLEWETDGESFLQALLTVDRVAAMTIARAAVRRAGVIYFYEQVILQSLERIGHLRAIGLISAVQQRVATAFAQTIVVLLRVEFPWPTAGPRALITHKHAGRFALSAQLVADVLALDGWEIGFVDADLPVPELVDAMDVLRPRLAACVVTQSSDLVKVCELVTELRTSAPACKTLISGDPITLGPFDAARLGVDAIAFSASQLVDEARPWK
jgi:MerR family transcriptional regulator, light-induced transcriptional regulator